MSKKIKFNDGLHGINNILEPSQWNDVLTAAQTVFIIIIGVSTIIMLVSEGGILYSSMRLPVWQNFMVLAEDPTLPARAHSEQGMHWSTVVMYAWMMFLSITFLKKRFTPVHNLTFSFCLFIATFVFPFEWIYVPLLDIFHNIPEQGFWMSTIMYGYWRFFKFPPIINWIMNSVIGRNGIMAMGLVFAHIIAIDNYRMDTFWSSAKTIYKFDKKSLGLAILVILGFAFWVGLPLFKEYPVIKGSKYFPQTIYVWYGEVENDVGDLWDIVDEEWVPDDMVRITNTIVKLLTVSWMFYTFIPKSEKHRYWVST